eukprot:TRINITY_DN430_c7_g1_i1.p1 TRINITY_DN430_c7_g1~~TRINITY_DN430_c7_g1_i1.p1  ORF type:complete len:456 (+),score=87.79 TRINITY_DN430_c7_g1_i1:78-1445(+)
MIRTTLLSMLASTAWGQSEQLGNPASLGDILGGTGTWGDAKLVYQGGIITFNGTDATIEEWGGNVVGSSYSSVDDVVCIGNSVSTSCFDTTASLMTAALVSNASAVTVGRQSGGPTIFELEAGQVTATDFATSNQAMFAVDNLDQGMLLSDPSHTILVTYNSSELRGYDVTVDAQNSAAQATVVINMSLPAGFTWPFLTSDYFLYVSSGSLYGVPLSPPGNPVVLVTSVPTPIKEIHTSDDFIFIVAKDVVSVYQKSMGLPVAQGTDVAAVDVNVILKPAAGWSRNASDIVYVERFNSLDVIVNKDNPLATAPVPTPVPAGGGNGTAAPGNGTTAVPSGPGGNSSTPTPGDNSSNPTPGSTPTPGNDTDDSSMSGNVTEEDSPVAAASDDESILGFSFTLFIIIFGGGGLFLLIILIAVIYCCCCKKSMANFDEFQPLNQMFEGNLISGNQENHV